MLATELQSAALKLQLCLPSVWLDCADQPTCRPQASANIHGPFNLATAFVKRTEATCLPVIEAGSRTETVHLSVNLLLLPWRWCTKRRDSQTGRTVAPHCASHVLCCLWSLCSLWSLVSRGRGLAALFFHRPQEVSFSYSCFETKTSPRPRP